MPASAAHNCPAPGCSGHGLVIRLERRTDGSLRRRLACKLCNTRWYAPDPIGGWVPLDYRPVVNRRPVVNLDTGVTYPDAQAAAKAVYVVRSTIRQAINKGWRAGGNRWQYLDQLPNVTMCEPAMALTVPAPDDGLTGDAPHYPN